MKKKMILKLSQRNQKLKNRARNRVKKKKNKRKRRLKKKRNQRKETRKKKKSVKKRKKRTRNSRRKKRRRRKKKRQKKNKRGARQIKRTESRPIKRIENLMISTSKNCPSRLRVCFTNEVKSAKDLKIYKRGSKARFLPSFALNREGQIQFSSKRPCWEDEDVECDDSLDAWVVEHRTTFEECSESVCQVHVVNVEEGQV